MTNLTNSSTSTQSLPESWIEKLFHRMLLTYGKKFSDQWGGADTDELIAYWAQEMASFSGSEIQRGIAAMESRDWPPTLPEFKRMCRPPIDVTVAYYEAAAGVVARAAGDMGKWSHPAIFWAAMPLSFDLANQTYSQVKARWEAAFGEQMALGEWAAIPKPMIALAAPGKSKTSRQEAEQRLRELGAIAVVKDAAGNDPKRWARRILEREANGDKTLLPIQTKFAREAMNMQLEVTA